MRLDNFLAGIAILKRYVKGAEESYPLGAEHDVFYFRTDWPLTSQDNTKVRELGWARFDDDIVDGECVPTDEPSYGSTWRAYT